MKIILAKPGHERLLSNYYLNNDAHFRKWNPRVDSAYHSVSSWTRRLEGRRIEFDHGLSAHFIGVDEGSSYIIGSCSLNNIVRGAFQACHMGYSIDQRFEGQGLMKKIVLYAIDYAFTEIRLNRIMANYMPSNTRSAGLLKSLGFVKEGYAKRYLLINGHWEGHVLNSLVNPANSDAQ